MMIGIMGAMREEITPLLEQCQDVVTHNYGMNDYHVATFEGHRVVIAYSKIGKVNAAMTATLMIEKFGIRSLLFTGVAGGIDPRLTIGDLVFGTSLVQHDVDITAFGHPWGFVPESGDFYHADEHLLQVARQTAQKLRLNCVEGVIATGDQFIASQEKKLWIHEIFKAVALEMEGASVAAVCSALGCPFFVLRSISDVADGDAGISFETFLESSAKQSAQFLTTMIRELVV